MMDQIGAADIVTQGAAAAGFAKVLVDLIKLSPVPSPSVVLPIFAFICSEGCAFLLFIANKGVGMLDSQAIALTVLVGIAATAGAAGITAVQNKANE